MLVCFHEHHETLKGDQVGIFFNIFLFETERTALISFIFVFRSFRQTQYVSRTLVIECIRGKLVHTDRDDEQYMD